MKILQICPKFFPPFASSGIVRVIYELSKQLVERGYDVTIYTSDAMDINSRIDSSNCIVNVNGIKIYYFRSILYERAWRYKFFITPDLARIIKKSIREYDIVHMHDYRTFQNIVAYYYAVKYNKPYILQAHGSLAITTGKDIPKKLFDLIWGYRMIQYASKLIALTKAEAAQYRKMSIKQDNIVIIPNGINLSEYKNLPKRGNFRQKYSIGDDEKIILYLGRLHKVKGLDLLVKAFAKLSKEYHDIKLVIVGPDNGMLNELKNLVNSFNISSSVIFTGSLYGESKLEALVDADIFVLPSYYETFPIAVLEAMACGLPIIITRSCEFQREINNFAGFSVKTSVLDLYNAIKKLIENENLRKVFGKNSIKIISLKFNLENIIKKYLKLYKSILVEY